MKSVNTLVLSLCLLALVSCDSQEPTPGLETWNPSLCTGKSSSGCGVDWFITLKNQGLPENVQILLNDKIVIDECDPQAYWSSTPTAQTTEFKIRDYANLDGTQKLSLRVFDLKDCSLSKTEKTFEADQAYSVESSGGVKRIFINRN